MLSNEVFDKVYTIIKVAIQEITITDDDGKTVKPYKDLNIVRSIREDLLADLPCVSIRQLGAPQIGNALEDKMQQGVNSTFQIDTYSNISYEEAYELMGIVGDFMNKLGYSLTYGFEELSSPTIWRFVARFNRIVGVNDTLAL